MKTQKTLVITGTHHTPAIETIRELRTDSNINWKIFYFSCLTARDSHLSQTIIPEPDITFYNIPSGKFNRRSWFKTVIGMPLTFFGFLKSLILLFHLHPDLVVSFGGYVSVPVVVASYLLKIPSLTHEQTLTISLATRINSHFVNKVALTFDPVSSKNLLTVNKTIVTGNPLRQEIFNTQSDHFDRLQLDLQHYPLIYVTAGSQGSEFINKLIIKTLPYLKNFTIIHQTGQTHLDEVIAKTKKLKNPHYLPFDYIKLADIGWILNYADIIISRAGANTCQELSTLHKKAILIPLPYTQQNEQLLNAQWLQSNQPQSTRILNQFKTSSHTLIKNIQELETVKLPPVKVINLNPHPLIQLIHDMA